MSKYDIQSITRTAAEPGFEEYLVMACFNLADGVVICNLAGVSVTIPEGGGAKAITAFLDAHWDAEVAANTPAMPLVVSKDIAALVTSADIAALVVG